MCRTSVIIPCVINIIYVYVFSDQLSEPCVRYQCGHLTCQNCAVIEESCHICLSQKDSFTYLDKPYSLRVKHASGLITTFEDAFSVDGLYIILIFFLPVSIETIMQQ